MNPNGSAIVSAPVGLDSGVPDATIAECIENDSACKSDNSCETTTRFSLLLFRR